MKAAPAAPPVSHVCFVDESGDEGEGRGSRWFVIAGVVCSVADVPTVEVAVDRMKTDVGGNASTVLHFRNLKHINRRQVCGLFGGLACATAVAIVSDTSHIPPPTWGTSPFRPRNWMYHYMTRYLLERVGRTVVAQGGTGVEVIMSNKTTLSYQDLMAYLKGLQREDPALAVVVDLKPRLPAQSLGVQLADVASSSVFFAFEEDRFKRREEAYMREIASRLWRPDGVLIGNGVKLMGKLAVQDAYVKGECSWLRTL